MKEYIDKFNSLDPKVKIGIALAAVAVVFFALKNKRQSAIAGTESDTSPIFDTGGGYGGGVAGGGGFSGATGGGVNPIDALNQQYDAEYRQAQRLYGLDKDRASFESDLQKQIATFTTDEANRRQLNSINADYLAGRNDIDLFTEGFRRQYQLELESQAANFDFLFGSSWANAGNVAGNGGNVAGNNIPAIPKTSPLLLTAAPTYEGLSAGQQKAVEADYFSQAVNGGNVQFDPMTGRKISGQAAQFWQGRLRNLSNNPEDRKNYKFDPLSGSPLN